MRRAALLFLLCATAACQKVPGAETSLAPQGPSNKEKVTVAVDTSRFEQGVRLGDIEKRLDALEARLAVGPASQDHVDLALLQARVDKLEAAAAQAAAISAAAAAAASRAPRPAATPTPAPTAEKPAPSQP